MQHTPSPGELWWDDVKERAFQLAMEGKKHVEIERELDIAPRTFYRWRHHRTWVDRVHQALEGARERFAERMLQMDKTAVDALPFHLRDSGQCCLTYLHRRGILPEPPKEVVAEVGGTGGGAVPVSIQDAKARLVSLLTTASQRIANVRRG